MEWVEFVRELRTLRAVRQPIHFVMAVHESLVLLDWTGRLVLEEREGAEHPLTFFIDRAGRGKGGGFKLNEAALADARWEATEAGSQTLVATMRGGHPIFTFTKA